MNDVKQKLAADERRLILELKPLLNAKFSQNPFKARLKTARTAFRNSARDKTS